jgi:hypothetical protein
MKGTILSAAVLLLVAMAGSNERALRAQSQPAGPKGPALPAGTSAQATLDRYCVTCHSPRMKAGGLVLDALPVQRRSRAADRDPRRAV